MNTKPAQLLVIDPQVQDYQSLLAGVTADTQVFILDPNRDGIEQITEILQTAPLLPFSPSPRLSSLHIISHGSRGTLNLGNTTLSQENLEQYSPQIQQWGKYLGENADILLYGCDVAAGETGLNFIQNLSHLTGADIAASDDKTGSAALGGDWELEKTTGAIEAIAISTPTYNHILAATASPDTEAITVNSPKVTIDVLANDTGSARLSVQSITTAPTNGTAIINDWIYVGGAFTTVNGTGRNYIARLNSDGTLDTTFDPGTGMDNNVTAIALDSTGKPIVGGWFTTVNGTGRNYIARLNTDGSLDTTFIDAGMDNNVNAIALNSTGQPVVGGEFTTVNGTGRNYIARLNTDGSLDTTFLDAGMDGNVRTIALNSTGQPVVGGDFLNVNSTSRPSITRLNTDGTLDTTFDPGSGMDNIVAAIALNSTGQPIVGGDFTTVNGTGRTRTARLNTDGSLDTTFDPGTGMDDIVYAIAIDSTNKPIVGGWFTTVNGTGRNYIARLNTDGSLDTTFIDAGMDNSVYAIAIDSNGQPVVGGDFLNVNSTSRPSIARLNTDGTLDTTFDPGSGMDSTVSAIALDKGRSISYTPNASFNGVDTFTYTATDGIAPSSTTVTVLVNDSPVLNNSGSPTLTSIYAGDTNSTGTLISVIISSTAGITDPNSGALQGIAITGLNTTNGTWQYTTDGTTWNTFTASATSARLLASDASTKIRFVPNAGYNGTITSAIAFKAWDQITGTNGSTADVTADLTANGTSSVFSSADETADITVNPLPTISSITSSQTDGTYGIGTVIPITVTFSEIVNVTGIPTLTLNTGANATYSSGSGSSNLIFNYTVATNNTTADLDYSTTTALALNGGTIKNASNAADAVLTLPTPGAANSLGANKNLIIDGITPTVTIEQAGGQSDPAPTSPINFTVTFSETVTGFDASDISFTGSTAGGTLTPTITGSGTTYNVAVSGMTTSGTVVPTVIANAATDAVGNNNSTVSTSTDNSVTYNTIPTVSNITKTGNEDNNITFAAADFTSAFTDADGNSLSKIKITSLPANGVLQLNGGNVSINDEILLANIPNLTFTPTANFNSNNGSSSFTWNGSDGSNYAPTDATANLTINSVNDAPSFSNAGNQTLTTWTNTTQTVSNWANTFVFGPTTDENSQTVADFLVSVTSGNTLFTTLPDVANDGTLTYTPNGTPGTATVQVQLKDNGGVVNGGVDTSTPITFDITIPPPTVNLSVNTTTGTEAGTTAITLTATAAGPVVGNQTLNLALTGTASNSDFSGTIPAQITIADGSNSVHVTLNVANDLLAEGDETATFTISNPTTGIVLGTTTAQTITITDDDTAGITVTPTGLTTSETGGTATFTVALNTQPTADVTINLSSDNTAEGTIDKTSLVFNAANWNTAQTVTVTGVDDLTADGNIAYNIITSAAISTDAKYNGINAADVAVVNSDNETAGFTVTPTAGLTTSETGGTATFTVALNTQPTADVTINLSSDNTAEGTIDKTSLVFNAANWNTAQTVTATGVDDFGDDGDIPYNVITSAATSNDTKYNGINPVDVAVTNNDNDIAGVSLSSSNVVTYEGGAGGSYTAVLTSKPTALVTVNFNGGRQINSLGAITFDSNNWNVPQPVILRAIDDGNAEGLQTEIISHTVTSSDVNYNGVTVGTVAVTITDNDTAAAPLVQPLGRMDVIESGGEDVYKLFLTTQPTGTVNVAIITDGQTTTNVPYLTFTPDDWNIPQVVRVSAVDDNVVEGLHTSNISFVANSVDGAYNNLPVSGITVSIADNDNVGVVRSLATAASAIGTGADDKIVGSSGADVINVRNGNNRVDGGAGDDVVLGGNDADYITGGGGLDQILSGPGEDYVDGGDDEDVILAGPGSDRVHGGAGNDKLLGEQGNDYLSGDGGADTLTGGPGRDAFAIGNGTGGMTLEMADVITDFVPGEDVIDLIAPLSYDGLAISDGTGSYAGYAFVQNALTGEFLARLQGVDALSLSQANFI